MTSMPAISGEPLADLIFVGLVIVIIPIVFVVLGRRQKRYWAGLLEQLENKGYALEVKYRQRPPGEPTHLWGRLPGENHPRVRVAERGLFERLKVWLGTETIQTGDAEFDRRFTVETDRRALATRILDGEMRRALLGLDEVDFETGSVGQLFSHDYYPEARGSAREQIWLWHTRIDRRLNDEEAEPWVRVGQMLGAKIAVSR